MILYEYKCPEGHITEERRPMERRNKPVTCHCGLVARRKLSVVNHTFGWRLTDNYLDIEGYPHELERAI